MRTTHAQDVELADLLERIPDASDPSPLINRVLTIVAPIAWSNGTWLADAEDAQQEGLIGLRRALLGHASGHRLNYDRRKPAAVLVAIISREGPQDYSVSIQNAMGITGTTPELRRQRDAKKAVRDYVKAHGAAELDAQAERIAALHNDGVRRRRKDAERSSGILSLSDIRRETRGYSL